MTDDLIAFLRARLDEDEQTARRVAPNQAPIELRALVSRAGGEPYLAIDSARFLREVEAGRRALRAHQKWCEGRCEAKYPEGGFDAAHYWSIKSRAAVYSDHPDYRDDWRP